MVSFKVKIELGWLGLASVCAFSAYIIYETKGRPLKAPKLSINLELDDTSKHNTPNTNKSSSSHNTSVEEINQSLLTSFDENLRPEKEVKTVLSGDYKDLIKPNPKSISKEASVQKTSIEQSQFLQIFNVKNNNLFKT